MRRSLLSIPALLIAAVSCSTDDANKEPRCLDENLDSSCNPAFTPTFENVFVNVLNKTCSTEGTSCHGPRGKRGGLEFGEPGAPTPEAETAAYEQLLGNIDGDARVAPGDPTCSQVVVRIESQGEPWDMPPNDPLPESVRCAIRQWIEAGAER